MTVMIADDSVVDREHLARIVAESGFDFVFASDGRDAVEKAMKAPPEIIFMDIVMPVLDGIAAARELARHARTKAIPVVFVTSKAAAQDRLWGKLLGCQDYIVKPYEAPQIIEQIDNAVARRLPAGATK